MIQVEKFIGIPEFAKVVGDLMELENKKDLQSLKIEYLQSVTREHVDSLNKFVNRTCPKCEINKLAKRFYSYPISGGREEVFCTDKDCGFEEVFCK